MKKTAIALAAFLALTAPAIANDTQDHLQTVIDQAVETVAEESAAQCGRYHEIRIYRSKTCAGQIFEDIEMDAPGGA